MSEMVERAVKAAEDYLETDNAYFDREEWIIDGCVDLRKLVTAIIARMRDPTKAMIEVGDFDSGLRPIEASWRAMVDEALGNPAASVKRTEGKE